jgi:peptidoglycan/LPS O-acetylase OafA/YrhL
VLFSLSYFLPIQHKQDYIFTNAPVFALGISLVELYKIRNWKSAVLPGCLLGFIGYNYDAYIFLLLLVSALIILFIKAEIKPMFLLGKISYSLYLTHSLVFIIVRGLLKQLHIDLAKSSLLWLCVELGAAISVAWLFYCFIEKPSLKLSKKIKYRRQAAEFAERIF